MQPRVWGWERGSKCNIFMDVIHRDTPSSIRAFIFKVRGQIKSSRLILRVGNMGEWVSCCHLLRSFTQAKVERGQNFTHPNASNPNSTYPPPSSLWKGVRSQTDGDHRRTRGSRSESSPATRSLRASRTWRPPGCQFNSILIFGCVFGCIFGPFLLLNSFRLLSWDIHALWRLPATYYRPLERL